MTQESVSGGSDSGARPKCVVTGTGAKEWWLNGELHREDGPALEWRNGSRWWYSHGRLHREDGPAVERADGTKEWFVNGLRHRDAGPALVRPGGLRHWYRNNKLHREDGPAVERADGSRWWYLHDHLLGEAVFNQYRSLPQSAQDVVGSLLECGANPTAAIAAARELDMA